ncbi:hypothetical protein MTO96_042618 [Rhipicephalus appendiculatus]
MEVLIEEPPSCVLGRLPLFRSLSDGNLASPCSLDDRMAGRGVSQTSPRGAHDSPTLLLSTVVPLTCGAGSLTPGGSGDAGVRRPRSSAVPAESAYICRVPTNKSGSWHKQRLACPTGPAS